MVAWMFMEVLVQRRCKVKEPGQKKKKKKGRREEERACSILYFTFKKIPL